MVSERTARRNRARSREARGTELPPTFYGELTVPGNYAFSGLDYRETANRTEVSIEKLRLMTEMDGHARGIFNIMRRPIQRNARNFEIRPPKNPKNGDGTAEVDFIESMFGPRQSGGMSIPLQRIIGQQAMAMLDGHAPFEKVFLRPGTFDDEFIRLKKLAYRDPRTITYLADESGGFDGFRQVASWRGTMIDKIVEQKYACYYAVNEAEQALYGKSYFLPAYYHFDKKHKAYYMTHLALMVGALPPRIAKANGAADARSRQMFLDALSNLGSNSAMIMPDGYELLDKAIQGAASGLPYMELIQHHNTEMSISVLAQALDIGTGGQGGGGFSLSKNHFDFLVMTLEEDQENMLDMWNNYVIPQLIDWNFGTTNYPKLWLPPFANDVRDMMGDIFGKLLTARQVPVSPEFVSEIERAMSKELGLDVEEEAINRNEANQIAQRELAQAMEEANLKIAQNPPEQGGPPVNATTRERIQWLLNSPEFQKFAERRSVRVRNRLLKAAVLLDDMEEED